MADFINIVIENDPDRLKRAIYQLIEESFPDWDPNKASLDKWIADGTALIGADLGDLTATVGKELFRQLGLTILAVPPLDSEAATATVKINVKDNAGYPSIPAGYQMMIQSPTGEKIAFRTREEVEVPVGVTFIEGITIEAIIPGDEANDLTGDPSPLDSISYITSIEQTSEETSGGADEETPDEYLDRLATELQLLTPTPIVPEDYEKLYRRIPGVYRAVAIDGYDPGDESENNERMVAVGAVDIDGDGVNAERKEEYKALAESMRETNFIVHTIDPEYTEIDVDVEVVALPGFDLATVKLAVEEALNNYLDPANSGNTPLEPRRWRQDTVVRQTELIWLVNTVAGVDYVKGSLELAENGEALGTADVALAGKASLTKPADMTVTAVAA